MSPIARATSFLIPARLDAEELLDTGAGTPQDVQANFADMRRINRYLGGTRALTQHLYPRLIRLDSPTTVIDVGTGAGDLLPIIRHWAGQHSVSLKLWGMDLSSRNLAAAYFDQGHTLPIQADAFNLPFRPDSVDYYISSLLLHHLPPEGVKSLLARSFQAARRGIIMSDLRRSRLALVAFRLSQPIFARGYLTRHDGAVSIRRAYTPSELLNMAREAGLPNPRVYPHPLWRMTLVADK